MLFEACTPYKKIYFIEEIFINHNRDIHLAKKLIEKMNICKNNFGKFKKKDINYDYLKRIIDFYREVPFWNNIKDQKRGLEFNWKLMMKLINKEILLARLASKEKYLIKIIYLLRKEFLYMNSSKISKMEE